MVIGGALVQLAAIGDASSIVDPPASLERRRAALASVLR